MLKKRNPACFGDQVDYQMLNDDNFSQVTETDHDLDDDVDDVSLPEEINSVTERVINTARRAEPTTKILKTSKHVVTLRKVNPEWLENYRNQESERYRHPLKPWEYILADQSM